MKTRLSLALLSCAVTALSAGLALRVGAAGAPSAPTVAWTPQKAASANAAIMAYLGEPVPPPADLDPKYTAEGLAATFQAACAKLGFELQTLAVDDTEFPFLVYGVVSGTRDLQPVQNAIRALPGYGYGGSVGLRRNGRTYFSLNLMPHDQYPRAQREAIQRRLMIRLQMLGAQVSDSTP
ncbi:MAG: hypothetical protein NTV51_18980 [Verrucomicrobia bacterium]|nr:hypothetical protein [Verrucomicrobiota bacterium]